MRISQIAVVAITAVVFALSNSFTASPRKSNFPMNYSAYANSLAAAWGCQTPAPEHAVSSGQLFQDFGPIYPVPLQLEDLTIGYCQEAVIICFVVVETVDFEPKRIIAIRDGDFMY